MTFVQLESCLLFACNLHQSYFLICQLIKGDNNNKSNNNNDRNNNNLLFIDKMIMREVKMRKQNLSMGWVDCKQD